MKISYDFVYQLCNFLRKLCDNNRKTSRVGGIFRVGRVYYANTTIFFFFFFLGGGVITTTYLPKYCPIKFHQFDEENAINIAILSWFQVFTLLVLQLQVNDFT